MSQHRDYTGGEAIVQADGATVGQVIDDLEARFPDPQPSRVQHSSPQHLPH